MLSKNIADIQADIERYRGISRAELFTKCVNKKLADSLANYMSVLELDERELRRKASIRVLKAATKLQKAADKEAILAESEE
jgi:hypothetical protein